MIEISNTARRIRKLILDSFVATGRARNVGDIMATLGLSRPAVMDAFREIASIDTFWVEKGTENIRLLSPFADLTTPYKVTIAGEQKWYAVCGIEALAVWVFFPGQTVTVDAYCRDCGEPMRLRLQDGRILEQAPERIVAHLGVPIARWFDDLPFA
jgi:hypothetical protein